MAGFMESLFFTGPDSFSGDDEKVTFDGWNRLRVNYFERINRANHLRKHGSKTVPTDKIKELLEAVIEPGDRVNLEGNNQKQADFLARALCSVNPDKVHDLHMVQMVMALNEHLDIFDKGIASKTDFCYSGTVGGRMANMVRDKKINIGAIHTYLEQYGRYFIDLTPRVNLVAADYADASGNLYTGYSSEDTPVSCEASRFKSGIVIAQVNEIRGTLPRVDIPGDWVDFVVVADKPYYMEPLFTRDPALITDSHILMGMIAMKGIYERYGVKSLNHGIGFNTAAIELMLPTYGEELGLKGKICTHWLLNPHPSLIPAIETGWVESVHCPGGELGMERYVNARPDIFFVGPDGNMRSNRAFAQTAGHYAIDMFIGSTLQIDIYGNSSTATTNRIAGFGGAPNMGCDAPGRRHATNAWIKAGQECTYQQSTIGPMPRGKKLVVQCVETFGEGMAPTFVDKLDAWELAEKAGFDIPPVMVYSDAITHIVTEEGIAYMHMCSDMEERKAAIRAVAGYTPVGLSASIVETEKLRKKGIVQTPEDLGIDRGRANKSILAAKNMRELVDWSGGLYDPPKRFRNW